MAIARTPEYLHRGGDPGTPRGYIDGLVYALYPALEQTLPGEHYLFDAVST